MKHIAVQPLTNEAFFRFGRFQSIACKQCEVIGEPPIEFFRDLLVQTLNGSPVAWSLCRVGARPAVIDTAEYHSHTAEGLMPLDGDMAFFVAPATPAGVSFPTEKVQVFYVPKHTAIVLHPGVWHHAPFAVGTSALNVLVTLPERTYVNDCVVVKLPPDDKVGFDIPAGLIA